MAADPTEFLHRVSEYGATNAETAVALLWWHGRGDHNAEKSANQLASEMEAAGFAKQNVSRLRLQLDRDRRTAKGSIGFYRIRIKARAALNDQYLEITGGRLIPRSNSVLPRDIFSGTRGYIEKTVDQINASFEYSLYDCCAVMSRRLLETLIIESYESIGEADSLKDENGNYLMLSGMLAVVEGEKHISLSRNGMKGLRDFKKLGDLSAHNRRFNAHRDDIERTRDSLRVASEELLHVANLK